MGKILHAIRSSKMTVDQPGGTRLHISWVPRVHKDNEVPPEE